jgi:5-methylcytosine-specific restriction endonuclease McrA
MDDESRLPALSAGRPPLKAESRPLASVPDDVLLRRLAEILGQSRRVETDLIAHIAEADERRLFAREAFASMLGYYTEALHLSEGEAYLRIAVARASREHPMLLPMLGDGRLHLSAIALLAPHLTAENRETLLRRAAHRSKRKIEELIAEVAPRKDAPSLMRRLPEKPRPAILAAPTANPSVAVSSTPGDEPTPSGMGMTVTSSPAHLLTLSPDAPSFSGPPSPNPPAPPPVVQPLAPGRYKVQFTASAGLHEKLQRLRALMRSQVPDGDLGAIIEAAVTEKVERLEVRRFAATTRPRKDLSTTDTSASSRHVPAAVRRVVRQRDGGRCRYIDDSGRRCEERYPLEYHHIHPFGLGGNHRPENIRLMCAQHNAYLADHDYGRETMASVRRSRRAATLGASSTPARAHAIATVASAGTAGGPPRVTPRGP